MGNGLSSWMAQWKRHSCSCTSDEQPIWCPWPLQESSSSDHKKGGCLLGGTLELVLESLVQSGLLAQKNKTETKTVQTFPKTKKTGPGPKKTKTAVFFGLFWSFDWSWSKPGFRRFRPVFQLRKQYILNLWVGRSICMLHSFQTSTRTLSYVENWGTYNNTQVHLQFV